MKSSIRLLGLLAAVAAAAIGAAVPAQADQGEGGATGRAVFVQTNALEGNAIAAYHRNRDGSLSYLTSYATGGQGGRQDHAGSDPIASQGSLVLVREANLLLSVNGGSGTVSVFRVHGEQLVLSQVLSSGGPFPSSFAVHDDTVYVLDAGGQGYVSGFKIDDGRLNPIEGSTRSLGLGNAPNPFFLSSPAQVGFTPDGEHLIVTTKTHGTVDVFAVGDEGRLSASPVKNATSSPVPFAFVFDHAGRLVLNFAGTSALQTFNVNADNTITPVSAPVSDTQAALCWATDAAGFVYTSNTGTGDVSQFRVKANGTVVLVNPVAAASISGATDSGAAGGQFLYVQSGTSSSVHAFSIGPDGSLTRIQIAAVPDGDDQEGIAVE
jgi:6-phosphogluconolactonase (cycloisomerase 2 family)